MPDAVVILSALRDDATKLQRSLFRALRTLSHLPEAERRGVSLSRLQQALDAVCSAQDMLQQMAGAPKGAGGCPCPSCGAPASVLYDGPAKNLMRCWNPSCGETWPPEKYNEAWRTELERTREIAREIPL